MSCSSHVHQLVTLPLPLLQERLLGKAMAFADEKAREIIEMEVGSRATPEAHVAKPKAHLCCCFASVPRGYLVLHALHVGVQHRQIKLTRCA